jgi:hypothetical protein
MIVRALLLGSLLFAALAYFLSNGTSPPEPTTYIQGRNATVLILTNQESGLSNVHLATAAALLEKWPEVELHYGSFPGTVETKLKRMTSLIRRRQRHTRDVIFHEVQGPSWLEALGTIETFTGPPGIAGIVQTTDTIGKVNALKAEDYAAQYRRFGELIDQIDPAVVVLDKLLWPAIDATLARNRRHVFVTPDTIADKFALEQPYGQGFWKYPA